MEHVLANSARFSRVGFRSGRVARKPVRRSRERDGKAAVAGRNCADASSAAPERDARGRHPLGNHIGRIWFRRTRVGQVTLAGTPGELGGSRQWRTDCEGGPRARSARRGKSCRSSFAIPGACDRAFRSAFRRLVILKWLMRCADAGTVPLRREAVPRNWPAWARAVYGGSTGGWRALALQVLYPDFFNGAWVSCPDPIDFHAYALVNLYKDDNAFYAPRASGRRVPIPMEREPDGTSASVMDDAIRLSWCWAPAAAPASSSISGRRSTVRWARTAIRR